MIFCLGDKAIYKDGIVEIIKMTADHKYTIKDSKGLFIQEIESEYLSPICNRCGKWHLQ